MQTTRFHHAFRRRSDRMAARGARAATEGAGEFGTINHNPDEATVSSFRVAFAIIVYALVISSNAFAGNFDGTWTITWVTRAPCIPGNDSYTIKIVDETVLPPHAGSISASGAARWTQTSVRTRGRPVHYRGTFRGDSGSGTLQNPETQCRGTFTARRCVGCPL
jgi:hypothetical protein